MRISVVMVCYNPNKETILNALNSLVNQVNEIVLVDNSDTIEKSFKSEWFMNEKFKVITLGDNLGIAEATNRGMKLALETSADYIMTSDQDTVYPQDYFNKFYTLLKDDEIIHNDVAAYVPMYFDRNTNSQYGFLKFNGKNTYMYFPKETEKYVEIFQGIASGMIISTSALKKIGLMNSDLFIDWVDLEWSWRAYFNNFKLLGCRDLRISHCLGDTNKKFFSKQITLRNPIRHYYIIRNCVYLSKYADWLPEKFRKTLLKKSITYLFGYTFLAKPHLKNFNYLLKGFLDGKNARLGKIRQ